MIPKLRPEMWTPFYDQASDGTRHYYHDNERWRRSVWSERITCALRRVAGGRTVIRKYAAAPTSTARKLRRVR